MVRKEGSEVTLPSLAERVPALSKLGEIMRAIGDSAPWPGHACGLAEEEYRELEGKVMRAHQANGWATEESVRHAFRAWGNSLQAELLDQWLQEYPRLNAAGEHHRTIGLVLAGNIPLVGLHDVLCVWLSAHSALVKCSTQEPDLIPALFTVLDRLSPGTSDRIVFTTGRLKDVDAVIATGSNNTARYFEHYFGHLPRIVRKSRVSVAVLDGTETEEELAGLAEDVFRYFGLGCRNVAKVYVPQEFDLDRLFKAFYPWKEVVNHNKYANNYDYTRALWLLDQVPFLENGFLLLREEIAMPSAMATLHYERYDDPEKVKAELATQAEGIQCLVAHESLLPSSGAVPFGCAQIPGLSDYADGVDTLRFLSELS